MRKLKLTCRVYSLSRTRYPDTLTKWNGKEIMENIVIAGQVKATLLGDLDPYTAYGLDKVAPYVLQEYTKTPDRPLELLFRKSVEKEFVPKGSVPWERKRANVVSFFKGDQGRVLDCRRIKKEMVEFL